MVRFSNIHIYNTNSALIWGNTAILTQNFRVVMPPGEAKNAEAVGSKNECVMKYKNSRQFFTDSSSSGWNSKPFCGDALLGTNYISVYLEPEASISRNGCFNGTIPNLYIGNGVA